MQCTRRVRLKETRHRYACLCVPLKAPADTHPSSYMSKTPYSFLLYLAQHPCFCFLDLLFKIWLLCVYFYGAVAPAGRTPETRKRNRDRKGNMFDTWREYLFLCLLKWFQLRSVTNSNHISEYAVVRQIFLSRPSVTLAPSCEKYAEGLAPLPVMLSASDSFLYLFFRKITQVLPPGCEFYFVVVYQRRKKIEQILKLC